MICSSIICGERQNKKPKNQIKKNLEGDIKRKKNKNKKQDLDPHPYSPSIFVFGTPC